jgi:hypothetical protein
VQRQWFLCRTSERSAALNAFPSESAQIETSRSSERVGSCAIERTTTFVTLADPNTTYTINSLLGRDREASIAIHLPNCRLGSAEGPALTDVTIVQSVSFNERGLLSISTVFSTGSSGIVRSRQFRTRTFDLARGQVIPLEAAVDEAGFATLMDTCFETMMALVGGAHDWATGMRTVCKAALDAPSVSTSDPADDAPRQYAVAADDLHLHVRNPAIWSPSSSETIVPVPWATLSGHVTNDKIEAVATSRR